MPGGSVTLNMPMDEDAEFVAVVGLFNRPDMQDNRWRLVLSRDDLDPDTPAPSSWARAGSASCR